MIKPKEKKGKSALGYKKWIVKDVANVSSILTLWDPFLNMLEEGTIFSLNQFKVTFYISVNHN